MLIDTLLWYSSSSYDGNTDKFDFLTFIWMKIQSIQGFWIHLKKKDINRILAFADKELFLAFLNINYFGLAWTC